MPFPPILPPVSLATPPAEVAPVPPRATTQAADLCDGPCSFGSRGDRSAFAPLLEAAAEPVAEVIALPLPGIQPQVPAALDTLDLAWGTALSLPVPGEPAAPATAPQISPAQAPRAEAAEAPTADSPSPDLPMSPGADPGLPLDPAPEGESDVFLRADRQEFEPLRQVVTAVGDVLIQFGTGQIAADRLWVNLANRSLRAEGNVFFNRNNQTIEGDWATYNLLQGAGEVERGRGELEVSTLDEDLANPLEPSSRGDRRPLDYRLQNQGTISQVTGTGRVAAGTSDPTSLTAGQSQENQRLRFESDRLTFDAEGWYAEGLRVTNDPFSPPSLEFRAQTARLTPINEDEDELLFTAPRIVLDQWLTIPILRRRYVLTRGQLPPDAFNPLPTGIGIDGRDRDGLFIERELPINLPGPWQLSLAPQFLVGRWLGQSSGGLANLANFGLSGSLTGPLGPRTQFTGNLSLSGLDLDNLDNRLRASFRAQHLLGTHRLNLEYSYRDRLFNGSLGFQDVQSSLGVLLESPLVMLGDSGIAMTYQVSGQNVTANSDRPDLIAPNTGIALTNLVRVQGAVDLSRPFTLWQGEPLPATPEEGLRYSDRPLVPTLALLLGLRGVATYYSSDDIQESLEGRVILAGQVGRLQRDLFDYTQFNLGFTRSVIGGDTSPFLFDRTVDQTVLSGGIVQQIYGPFLAGFQSSLNLDTGVIIDTNLIFEYRRRAYGLLVTYNPKQETGFLGFRISTFDWMGRTNPFDAPAGLPSGVMVR